MEEMAASMEKMVKDVAKKDDIAAMSGRAREVEGTVKGLGEKVDTIEHNVQSMRAQIDALKNREPSATTREEPRLAAGRP